MIHTAEWKLEFFCFMPQVGTTFDRIVERARIAEEAGFTGVALIDHVAAHGAAHADMFESFVTATWIAAHTSELRVGHLVVYDLLRQPALLAKSIVGLDYASGGRFDLGIGSGSVRLLSENYGYPASMAGGRTRRLAETLEVVTRLLAGETVTFDGEFHHFTDVVLNPVPLGHIPIVVGGSGPRTAAVATRYANWWNFRLHEVGNMDVARARAGGAGLSTQNMVAFVAPRRDRDETIARARRRFGDDTPSAEAMVVGGVGELTEHFGWQHAEGVERICIWFTDGGRPETLQAFGDVITSLTSAVRQN